MAKTGDPGPTNAPSSTFFLTMSPLNGAVTRCIAQSDLRLTGLRTSSSHLRLRGVVLRSRRIEVRLRQALGLVEARCAVEVELWPSARQLQRLRPAMRPGALCPRYSAARMRTSTVPWLTASPSAMSRILPSCPRTCLSETTYPGILNPNGTCESGITTAEKRDVLPPMLELRLNQPGLNSLWWLFNSLVRCTARHHTAPPKVLQNLFHLILLPSPDASSAKALQ